MINTSWYRALIYEYSKSVKSCSTCTSILTVLVLWSMCVEQVYEAETRCPCNSRGETCSRPRRLERGRDPVKPHRIVYAGVGLNFTAMIVASSIYVKLQSLCYLYSVEQQKVRSRSRTEQHIHSWYPASSSHPSTSVFCPGSTGCRRVQHRHVFWPCPAVQLSECWPYTTVSIV